MNILDKIQKLSLGTRKIILLILVILAASVLFWFWVKNFNKQTRNFKKEDLLEQFKIPSLQEKINEEMPKIEIPSELQNFSSDSLMVQ